MLTQQNLGFSRRCIHLDKSKICRGLEIEDVQGFYLKDKYEKWFSVKDVRKTFNIQIGNKIHIRQLKMNQWNLENTKKNISYKSMSFEELSICHYLAQNKIKT